MPQSLSRASRLSMPYPLTLQTQKERTSKSNNPEKPANNSAMAESNKEFPIQKVENFDPKWDACLDLSLRRFVYSSLAGAFTGLLFFRSRTTRWASVAFGAGLGLGSAYSDCSRLSGKPTAYLRHPTVSGSPVSQDGQE